MRLYTFINFYLSQIQQGIQSAHLVHELFNKYRCDIDVPNALASKGGHVLSGHLLDDWSRNHKTIIVCNAGADPQVQELIDEFKNHYFPWTEFVEDEGLCKARTGCGIVLPANIYEAQFKSTGMEDNYTVYYEYAETIGDATTYHRYTQDHPWFNLIKLVKSKRLA